jgi:predicted SAM-dependent methyltransferase
MKLHFGSGGHQISGFESHDTDLPIDKPLPFPDASVDACFASHVAEHIATPLMLNFLTECYRILKPGGWMRLSIPVIGPWLERDHARDLTLGHGHLGCYNEELLRTMFWMAGFDQQKVRRTERWEGDHHHLTIGLERDDAETCRMMATK